MSQNLTLRPSLGLCTIREMLERSALHFGEKTALQKRQNGSYEKVSYRELQQRAKLFGAGLLALGLHQGDRVGLVGENRIEWAVSYLGIVIANLILAFFNLIPIPPLDGSKVLMGILPQDAAQRFSQLEQFGPLILIALILSENIFHWGVIGAFLFVPVRILGFLFTGQDLGFIL